MSITETASVRVGVIGDYDPARLSHGATDAALAHAADRLSLPLRVDWLPTLRLERADLGELDAYHALFCAPGSPYVSLCGALRAIAYARENKKVFFGTCGGFQHAILEFALHVLDRKDLLPAEGNDPSASSLFVSPLSCPLFGEAREHTVLSGTRAAEIYQSEKISERYNCSFGVNPSLRGALEKAGFRASVVDKEGDVRMIELPAAGPFYMASLFQPQLSSTGERPHPILLAFLSAASAFSRKAGPRNA